MPETKYSIEQKATALRDALSAFSDIAEKEDGRCSYFVAGTGWAGDVLMALLVELREASTDIPKPAPDRVHWAIQTMRFLGDMPEATSRRVLEVLIGPLEQGPSDG